MDVAPVLSQWAGMGLGLGIFLVVTVALPFNVDIDAGERPLGA